MTEMLDWIASHPYSNLYPRQLPVSGLDSKWLDGRKGLLTDLVAAIQEDSSSDLDFYQRCGLKAPPLLVRMRVLDQSLRAHVGGVGDITAPVDDLAGISWPVSHVFIVENLQTGLAMASAPSVLPRPSVKRRIDPIDAPARPLGTKRSALVAKRADSSVLNGNRNTALVGPGDTLLATADGAVIILLRATNYGLLMERTQRQGVGMRLVQMMVFGDVKSFDNWCAVEPLRFEDGLLFSKLVREGHAAFADLR